MVLGKAPQENGPLEKCPPKIPLLPPLPPSPPMRLFVNFLYPKFCFYGNVHP